MLIDWFTVIAQVINFLILVWLLKRFLYKPILEAIDEREKRIATELEQAETTRTEAARERDEFRRRNEALEQQQEVLVNKMTAEVETERQELLDKARREYDILRSRLKESWNNEQIQLSGEIIRRTQQEVFDIARKVLADLADTSLEEQMAVVFTRKLRDLSSEELARLRSIVGAADQPVKVRNVFGWSSDHQAIVAGALEEILGAGVQLDFETATGEVSGIELSIGGYQLAWTIDTYLTSLEARLDRLLEVSPATEPASAPAKETIALDQEKT